MKKIFCLIILSFVFSPLFSLNYKSTQYFYSIDAPDNYTLIDDSKVYNAFFRNDKKSVYFEVNVYAVDTAKSNEAVLNSFISRYKMTGDNKNIKFCKYSAIRGEYSLTVKDIDLKMDIVVFKDSYYYYVIMAYSKSDQYTSYKKELRKIVNSFKIYYDNNVVYSNDRADNDAISSTDSKTDTSETPKNDKVTVKTKSDKSYNLHSKWDNFSQDFTFFNDDYYSAVYDGKKIVKPSIWSYFKIDTQGDSDYNFKFWKNFYQEMFNKNIYRVSNIVDWFKEQQKVNNWSSYELAENVIKCIQVVIPYKRPHDVVSDKEQAACTLDYFTPNEIAWNNAGDCDTKSLFIVMVLKQLGFDACMYYSEGYGHAMCGVSINANGTYFTYGDKKYYFIESTYPGWKIGDLPPEMKNTSKWRLIPIL